MQSKKPSREIKQQEVEKREQSRRRKSKLLFGQLATIQRRVRGRGDVRDLLDLYQIARCALQGLQELSAIHKSALVAYVNLLQSNVLFLNEDLEARPEKYKSLIQRSAGWPIIFSHHASFGTKRSLMDELGSKHLFKVGKKSGGGKNWNPATTASEVAYLTILELMRRKDRLDNAFSHNFAPQDVRSASEWELEITRLPPLGSETVEIWFSTAWKMVLQDTQNRPEDVQPFASLVKPSRRADKADSRYEIQKRLKKAFKQMLAPSSYAKAISQVRTIEVEDPVKTFGEMADLLSALKTEAALDASKTKLSPAEYDFIKAIISLTQSFE